MLWPNAMKTRLFSESSAGKVVQIDEMLKVVETRLTALYKHEVDENLRGEGFRELDVAPW